MQSVKRCLKKVVGKMTLTFIELQTVLYEIECILNSRPLCALHDDNDLVEPLTPNHLLFGRKLAQNNIQAPGSEVNLNLGPKRSCYIESVVQQFWERWRREYVITLREWKHKYKQKNKLIPETDDVVLVYEEKVPRQNWTLGRVINVIKGRDGEIRGAKVVIGKTRAIVERPINKLYPIEFAKENCVMQEHLGDNATVFDNTIEFIRDQVVNNNYPRIERPKRNAAIMADIKMKYQK